MRSLILALTTIGVVGSYSTAFALNQSEHADITEAACEAAGFAHDFCERVADAAYNTDHYEFENLAAHAQPEDGESSCSAAGKAMQRLLDLGREARAKLRQVKARPNDHDLSAEVATAMGRALHTIEDNCAHSGMPNPQHAWHSLSDSCRGTHDSPDIHPDAVACARREAAEAFRALRTAATQIGLDPGVMEPYEEWRSFPPRGEVCAFLHAAPTWDGRDRRWNNDVVVPAFRSQFAKALTSDNPTLDAICTGGQTLARANRFSDVNTSAGQEFCLKIQAYCIGKGDDDGSEEAPPWDEGHAEHGEGGGCSATNAAGGWLALALGMFAMMRPRRTRR